MEDQDMAAYEPVGPTETAAQETKESLTDHPNRPHTHRHAVGRINKKKKNRASGAMTMKQLASVLARSSLSDNDSKRKNSEDSRKNHINLPRTQHQMHSHHNKKRNHNSGTTTMRQLARALAQSNLRDGDDSQSGHGKKLTKKQRKRQQRKEYRRKKQERKKQMIGMTPKESHEQRSGFDAATDSGSQNGQGTTRDARRRKGMLPLPFDNLYLSKVQGFWSFMTNDQIMDWVKSIFKPHIEDWYRECLSVPGSQSRIEAAQANPYLFAKSVADEAMDQHDSSERLRSLLGETDTCPAAFHLEKKQNNSLTFIQHSAMVACLVVRDGQVSHSFSDHARKRKRHQAAATLLASVIMDLKTDFGYFVRLLLDFEEKDVSTSEDGKTLAAMEASEEEEQGVGIQASIKKAPRILRLSSEVFGSIGRALLGLKHNSGCEISFRRSETSGEEYRIVLDGTIDQVREAQQAIQTLADSSPVSADLDLLSGPESR